MKIKIHTSLLQNILIGIFVSVVSGMIVFFLTEYHHAKSPTPTELPVKVDYTDNAIYGLLLQEQQKLNHFNAQLAEKEQELLSIKGEEGFTGHFFDSAEAGKIRQSIDFLEESIEEAEGKIIKFSYELDRMSKRSEREGSPILTLIAMGITFVAVIIVLGLLNMGG